MAVKKKIIDEKDLNLPQRIKIFQEVRKKFANVGIYQDLALQAYPFNGKILIGFLIVSLVTLSSFKFIFHGAKSFIEYTQCSYTCSLCVLIFFILITLVFEVDSLFRLMNGFENLVNTSE